jgi:hypothetical protein
VCRQYLTCPHAHSTHTDVSAASAFDVVNLTTSTPAFICHHTVTALGVLSASHWIISTTSLRVTLRAAPRRAQEPCDRQAPALGYLRIRTAALTCRHTRNTASRSVETSLCGKAASLGYIRNLSSKLSHFPLPTSFLPISRASIREDADMAYDRPRPSQPSCGGTTCDMKSWNITAIPVLQGFIVVVECPGRFLYGLSSTSPLHRLSDWLHFQPLALFAMCEFKRLSF